MSHEIIQELFQKTILWIDQVTGIDGSSELIFVRDDGKYVRFFHVQDCCETVDIEDINGDLQDLTLSPILDAYVSTTFEQLEDDSEDSQTWTFYSLRTQLGSVNIRWYGTSNGYYSEEVTIREYPWTKDMQLRFIVDTYQVSKEDAATLLELPDFQAFQSCNLPLTKDVINQLLNPVKTTSKRF